MGDETGNNLFVNIGSLKDPGYKRIVKDFGIKQFPVIIITAIERTTFIENLSTVYVRLDNRNLLNNSDKTIDAVGKLFNLFISEQIPNAVQQANLEQRNATLSYLKSIVDNGLKEVWDYVKDRDITISLIEGKLQLKSKGG